MFKQLKEIIHIVEQSDLPLRTKTKVLKLYEKILEEESELAHTLECRYNLFDTYGTKKRD